MSAPNGGMARMDLKGVLHDKLKASRAVMVDRVEGLGEYDRRRPITPTGPTCSG